MWENWKYYQRIQKQIKDGKIILWGNKLPSQVYYKYPPECTFDGRKVLNIGCGKCVYKAPNVVNVDIEPFDGINLVHDLSKPPLPFADNSFELVIANHCIEHIPNWFECLKDLARILAPGGMLEIWIPPISSDTAFAYRDHINRIGLHSFTDCFNLRQADTNLLADLEHKAMNDHWAQMELVWAGYKGIIAWWMLVAPPSLVDWMVTHLRNVVSEEGFKFIKRGNKDGRN